jgi:predicted metal-dependent phosphoesterase TrpH
MGDRVDLHIHSDRSSDGELSPARIVQLAREADLRAISIADHDTVASYPEAIEFGKEEGVEVIPSCELTTLFEGREFHLLLPFVDWESRVLLDLVEEVAERRRREAQERVRKLQDVGFDITWEEVLRVSHPFPPLGVTIAQVVLKKAEERGDKDFDKYLSGDNRLFAPYYFYRDYFMEGKPASVPRQNLDLLEVLDRVSLTGGVPVVAHPGADFQRANRSALVRLKERGLVGLEVYSSYHDKSQRVFYKTLAEELDLVPTAGSDFHGTIKPHVPFGGIEEGEYWMVEELRKRRL